MSEADTSIENVNLLKYTGKVPLVRGYKVRFYKECPLENPLEFKLLDFKILDR
jgi:hypothetical protein